MANAQGIVRRLSKVFDSVQVTQRPVYKRLLSRGGGDPLIGRYATVTTTDTKMSPQPVVSIIAPDRSVIISGVRAVPATDYNMLVLSTAISQTDLENPDMVLVLKDSSGHEEEMTIAAYAPVVLQGTVIVYNVLARSRKR